MISTLLLIIIYLSFISLGLPDSLLGSAWPSMYLSLSVPVSYAGIISVIITGGTVISSLLSGRIIKRFGTGLVTLVSVTMTAAALLGFSAVPHFAALCVFAVPLGLGAGSVDAALNNYVALRYKALHMNWLHCFWGLGASIGPIIMSRNLLETGSWQSGYLTIGILQFCLVVILLISFPLWKKAGVSVSESEENSGKSMPLLGLLRISGVPNALAAFFCYCALEAAAGLWGASYLVLVRGISPETAAQWISLYYLGITIGRFLSGFLSIKLENRQTLRLGHGLIAVGIASLFLPFGGALLPISLFLIGLGCAPIFPGLLHDTPKNFGKEHSGEIIGVQMAFAYIGSSLMPPLFGLTASLVGYGLFPFFLIALLVVMFIMTEALDRKTKAV